MNITEYLQSHPLLRLIAVLITGIAVGYGMQTPQFLLQHGISVTTACCYALLASLLISALLRRHCRVASVALLSATFLLGIFLIKSERHTYTVPFAPQIEQFMEESRAELSAIYQTQGLSDDEYAIVAAMTLGERQRVSTQLREIYSITGASHLFALSGLHLSIIYMMLTLLQPKLLLFKLRRLRRPLLMLFVVLQIVTIWAYVLLVGCHASLMRAAVMLTTYTIARQMSRHPENISVLAFTCALLLAIYPEWLFDVGFQMSFMAVLSITLLYIPLRNKLFTDPSALRPEFLQPLWKFFQTFFLQMLLLSFCAQIGVAPLIALYFGRFSCYFLLTNLLVPILTTLTIYLSLSILLFGLLSTWMPALCGSLLSWLVPCVIACVKTFNGYLTGIASLPYSSIDGIHINVIQTFLIYIIIFCSCMLAYHLHHGLRRRLNRVQADNK